MVALTAPPGHGDGPRWWWPAEQAAQIGEFRLGPAKPGGAESLPLVVLSDPHLYDASAAPTWSGKLDPTVPLRSLAKDHGRAKGPAPGPYPGAGRSGHGRRKGPACLRPRPDGPGPAGGGLAARSLAGLPRQPRRALRPPWGGLLPVARVPGPGAQPEFRGAGGRAASGQYRHLHPPGRHPRPCGILPQEALDWLKAALALLPPKLPFWWAATIPWPHPWPGSTPCARAPWCEPRPHRPGPAQRGPERGAGHDPVGRPAPGGPAQRPSARRQPLGPLGAPSNGAPVGRPGPVRPLVAGGHELRADRLSPAYMRGALRRGPAGWSLELGQVVITLPRSPGPRPWPNTHDFC